MPSAENAKLEYEAGQTAFAMHELTNSGDNTVYTSSADLWSAKSGFAATVRPNGLATGGTVISAVSGSNDVVDVAALTCYLAGTLTTVAADTDVSITRPATNVAKINSITVDSGGAIAVVAGTDGASTTFSETRGAAGGPPYIPTTSIEIAQIRVTSSSAAVIASTEIFQVVGLHRERYDYPVWDEVNNAGEVHFVGALATIHTGDLPKKVFASYFEPIFTEISIANDFTAPETTHSTTSTQVYGKTIASSSSSLGQGGFTAYLNDGVSDALVGEKNTVLWFRFYPDRYKAPYILTQGKLGITRTWPAGDNVNATCTISAETEATEVSG